MSRFTLAESNATAAQRRFAGGLVATTTVLTVALVPLASNQLPNVPGFVAVYLGLGLRAAEPTNSQFQWLDSCPQNNANATARARDARTI